MGEPPGSPINFVASTPGAKRDGLSLRANGWRTQHFRAAGGPVLWNHEHARPAIGTGRDSVEADRLRIAVHFDQEDPFATAIESKVRRRILRASSVGWDFTDEAGRILDHWRMNTDYLTRSAWYDLTEHSIVNVPADPMAVAERSWRAMLRLSPDLAELLRAQERPDSDMTGPQIQAAVLATCHRLGIPLARGVSGAHTRLYRGGVPPHRTRLADPASPWDAAAELANASGASQLRRMHAWVDYDGDPDAPSSYELPHHGADGAVVWRGVAAAMGRQTDIPEADRAGVHRHLAAHHRQFGKSPPAGPAAPAATSTSIPAYAAGRNHNPSASAAVDTNAARAVLAAFTLEGAS